MGLFDRFKSPKIAPVSDMISFAIEWRDKYLATFALKNNANVRIEALLFTSWYTWYHCLEEDKVSRAESYLYDFFSHLMAHLSIDDKRFEEIDFFLPLFKNRYAIFGADLRGLIKSHYPETKQYIPLCTYKAFCLEPTKIINPASASITTLTWEQDEEMMSFAGNFISFISEMSKAVQAKF